MLLGADVGDLQRGVFPWIDDFDAAFLEVADISGHNCGSLQIWRLLRSYDQAL